MIFSITLNPSLDYIVKTSKLNINSVNRTNEEMILPGGKGLNVSMVLRNLGINSISFGFIAGFTGAELKRLIAAKGIKTDFIQVRTGMSRINVKVRAEDTYTKKNIYGEGAEENKSYSADQNLSVGEALMNELVVEETEINGMGPTIDAEAMEELYHRLDQLATGDFLVLAGSIPPSLPKSAYADMMERLSGRGIRFVVDATGEALLKTLPFHPFLIKPNHHELGAIFGVDLVEMSGGNFETLKENVKKYACELQKMGALNVLISMGGMGAMLVTEQGQEFYAKAPEGKVVNSVGAGDSMVAGFLAGYLQEEEKQDPANDAKYLSALRMGICAGSASAFSRELATKEEVMELLKQY